MASSVTAWIDSGVMGEDEGAITAMSLALLISSLARKSAMQASRALFI
jgi:hypothetical protein